MAPAPAPWAVLGDALWCLGLGCLLAAARDALRLALGEGKLRCFLRDAAFFAAAAVLICGFAAGTSAGGLLGVLCWHWAVQPAVHRAASMLAVLLLGPLHAAHKMLLQPLQDRAAQARTVRKSRKTAKKSRKTQKSAEKQLQKPSIILYN